MAKTLRRWVTVWALGCLAAGVMMAFGDGSHLPWWAVPIVMTATGAVGGIIGGLLFCLAGRRSASRGARLIAGAGCGLVAGAALYFFGIGIILTYCLVAGAALGLLSAARG